MKIFVSIVSYRDPLLKLTIDSILESASGRHEITVGVFEQTVAADSLEVLAPDLIAQRNIRYMRINPEYSYGVGFARHVNSLQMKDEDFLYQIDSHMLFDKGWDRKLINDYRKANEKHSDGKIIITGSCKNWEFLDGKATKQLEDMKLTCRVRYFDYRADCDIVSAHGDHIPPTDDVMPAIHICAGNTMFPASWIKQVGVDPYIFFEGEEQILTLSSFAAGYHMYHPRSMHCYHFLGTHGYITKQSVQPVIPEHVLGERIYKSHQYLKQFIANLDDAVLEEYREYSGVDYINQCLEEKAKTYTITLGSGPEPVEEIPAEVAEVAVEPTQEIVPEVAVEQT
jgi:hypothetical protein